MYTDPDAVESKSATKADPTAPARSAIRRQPALRLRPNVRDRSSPSSSRLNRHAGDLDRRRLFEAMRRGDLTADSRAYSDLLDVEAEADLAHVDASQRRRVESGRALLRDALSYERPGHRMRLRRDAATASLPATGSATALQHGPDSDPRPIIEIPHVPMLEGSPGSPPPEYMPTPPYTSGDRSGSSSHESSPPLRETSAFTHRFAPAYRLDDSIINYFRDPRMVFVSTSEQRNSDERLLLSGVHVPTSTEIRRDGLDGLPPLRRMRHRTNSLQEGLRDRPLANGLDGLGDRRRSFSPDDDSWETLLTTLTPDERLPGANSSFASATASSSAFSSTRASSRGALTTAPSLAPNDPGLNCDNSESEDSTLEEDVRAIDGPSIDERRVARPSYQPESDWLRMHRGMLRTLQQQNRERLEQYQRQQRLLEREEDLQDIQGLLERTEEIRRIQAELARLRGQGPE